MIRFNKTFCDWLNISFSRDSVLFSELAVLVEDFGFTLRDTPDGSSKRVYESPKFPHQTHKNGIVHLSSLDRVFVLSFSGGSLEFLRHRDNLVTLLYELSQFDHFVTRLDVALDKKELGSSVMHRYRSTHPKSCRLTRKNSRTRFLLCEGPDGLSTGTFYVGNRNSTVMARVYDKAYEMASKELETGNPFAKSHYLANPITRYEISVKGIRGDRKNPTLRDAVDCDSIYWHFVSPGLLPAPDGVLPWEPQVVSPPLPQKPPVLPYERFKRHIEGKAFFAQTVRMGLSAGLSKSAVVREVVSRLESVFDSVDQQSSSDDWRSVNGAGEQFDFPDISAGYFSPGKQDGDSHDSEAKTPASVSELD